MPFPVDIQYVRRAEEELGVRFPPEFVLRMVTDNGGGVDTEIDHFHLHPFFDDGNRKRLKRTCNDIVRETRTLREFDWFPATGVTVGTNGANDHLVFLPRDDDTSILDTTLFVWTFRGGELEPLGDTSELFTSRPCRLQTIPTDPSEA